MDRLNPAATFTWQRDSAGHQLVTPTGAAARAVLGLVMRRKSGTTAQYRPADTGAAYGDLVRFDGSDAGLVAWCDRYGLTGSSPFGPSAIEEPVAALRQQRDAFAQFIPPPGADQETHRQGAEVLQRACSGVGPVRGAVGP